MVKKIILGIDLGTTNTCVAARQSSGKDQVLEIAGSNTVPSVVCFKDEKNILVGKAANNQRLTSPKNTIYGAKRLFVQDFNSKEIKEMAANSPYEIVSGKNDQAYIKVTALDKVFSPQEVSAQVLRKVADEASAVLGQKITDVVITVPAYFNDSQRNATKDAGKIAGLNVLRIINEPTAAALAYGLDQNIKAEKTIAVYDFGGGTFDISILTVDEHKTFEVLATNGSTRLGGELIDERLLELVLKEFKNDHAIDLRKDPMALQRIKEAVEKAKIQLSSEEETEINLPFIAQQPDQGNVIHFNTKITRKKFEQMVQDIVEDTLEPCRKCLKDAGNPDIHEVILVGGSTKIPLVRQEVEKLFKRKPSHSVNPDEAVALGASIQAAILSGDQKDVVLLDVTPLTLSIETMGGVATPVIPRNSSIPTKKSQVFSTAVDNQPSVDIHVLQGERGQACDNKSLGRFQLSGIAPAPRGVPQIEVTFDIDTNGILNISALDKTTGKKNNITIQANDGLTDEEIEKMQKDGEKYAEEDRKKKEIIEAKNAGDNIIYEVEKNLSNAPDEQVKADAEKILKELKEAIGVEDLEKMKAATTQLQHLS
ncbi:MAG: molecular chaperone DnaK [Pseudomonadota bacterium]